MAARAVAQAKRGLSADPECVVGALHVHGPVGGVASLGGQALEGRRRTRRRSPGNRRPSRRFRLSLLARRIRRRAPRRAIRYTGFTIRSGIGDSPPLTNTDPFTGEGIYRRQFLWMMGYPDQALAANQATGSQRAAQGPSVRPRLCADARCAIVRLSPRSRCAAATLPKRPNASARSTASRLLGEIMVEISRGVAWLVRGAWPKPLPQLDQGIERLMQTGHRIWIWYLKALARPKALALTGDIEGAWSADRGERRPDRGRRGAVALRRECCA